MKQILIDKITVPQNSLPEFTERMNINRNFIKTLPGFINDSVYAQTADAAIATYITVAVWENEQAIQNAKDAVQALYKQQGFDMPAMLERLDIKIYRGIYQQVD